jgi:polyisoprenoid-binding protein YceI
MGPRTLLWTCLFGLMACGGGDAANKPAPSGPGSETPVVDPAAAAAAAVEAAAAADAAVASGDPGAQAAVDAAAAAAAASAAANAAAAAAGLPVPAPVVPVPGAPVTPAAAAAAAAAVAAGTATPAVVAPTTPGAPAADPAAAAAAAAAATAATPAAATRGPTSYKLDAGSSWIYAVLKYDRDALMKGHDHVIKATTFDGSVTWSPTDPSACKVNISFSASALAIDPPGARAKAGLDGETDEENLPKIKENMLSKTQINSSSFPTISFVSTSCSGTSGSVKVTGNLSIHGVAKSVTAAMNITEDGATFSAKGSTSITHRMFGFDPFTAALGALKNDDNLKLYIDVKGRAN